MRINLVIPVMSVSLLLTFTGCESDGEEGPGQETIPIITYSNLGSHPHDTNSYTEGLLISNDSLFESTGSPSILPQTRSVFGPVDLATGKIAVRVELDKEKYFGEGLAFLDDKFYQLTWRNKIGFVYDASSYETIGHFSFLSDQGWGLTTDGESLIMSDGTNKLTWIDPETFLPPKMLLVTENGSSDVSLNELEFIEGYVYANVYPSSRIIKIDTSTGKVVGQVDLTTLAKEARNIYPGAREMNGIAFDPVSGKVYITGKLWPGIYEIRFSR